MVASASSQKQPAIPLSTRREAFLREPPPTRDAAVLRFAGLPDGLDVYNATPPFPWRGGRALFGRVEPHDRWAASWTALFRETAPDAFEPVPEFRWLEIEDPFLAVFGDEWILGGTRVKKAAGEVCGFRCDFFRGSGPLDLTYFASGPDDMKDLRLAPLPDGRAGLFTRPRGPEIVKRYGSESVVGWTVLPSPGAIGPDVAERAEVVPGLFGSGEWGGCNQCVPLPDGRIGVAAHLCHAGEAASNGKAMQHYCNAAFVFDPATGRATPPRLIATRATYGGAVVPKEPHLADCAFTSGLVRRPDGLWDLYSGLCDAAEGRVTLLFDPFAP